MLTSRTKNQLVLALLLCGWTILPCNSSVGLAGDDTPGRVVTGLSSANELVDDLEWIVVTLGKDQKTWDNVLKDAVEIFLIGVDPERPVGMDFLFDSEDGKGKRTQYHIPLADMEMFIEDNLEPIDIQAKKRGKNYWKLVSESLGYEGWMRLVDGYASIAEQPEDVPKDMPSPQPALDALLGSAYDLAGQMSNTADGIPGRREAMARIQEEVLSSIKKRTDETRDEYELRKALARHQLDRMERIFAESEVITIGWTTDAEKEEARAVFEISGLPGTELSQVLQQYGAKPSYFSAIPLSPKGIIRGRIHLPVDKHMQEQADEFYKLVEPVWKHRVETKEGLTESQRTARKKVLDIVLQMLDEGRTVGAIDSFLEIQPNESGTHTFLFGIRTADGTKVLEILKLIPSAIEEWKVDLDVDNSHDVKIHRITFTEDLPQAMKTFYGDSGEIYVGTHADAIWISGGDNAFDHLKQAITKVHESEAITTNEAFSLDVKLGPIITHLDDLATEMDFSLEQWLGKQSEHRQDEDETEEEDQPQRPGQALKHLNLKEIALPELQNKKDDHVHFRVVQENGKVKGTGTVEKGVLRAAGKIIGTVAKEKLGG